MLKYTLVLLTILLFTSLKTFSQDQLIYKAKPAKYVDKILAVTNDSISYKNFKKTKKIPLSKISGYYITIETEENLKKGFHRRKRTYHPIINEKRISQSKLDPNKSFTDRQLRDLNKFNPNKFKNGFFVQNGDTNNCKIFTNKKTSPNNHLFLLTMDNNGKRKSYRASEIDFYFVENNSFQAYQYENEKIKTVFFLKLIEKGEFYLYERNSIPSHQEFTYFLKKEGEDYFYEISPNKNSVELKPNNNTYENSSNNGYDKLWYNVNNSKEEFKVAINKLFGTCLSVRNRIIAEFYTQNDLPVIVREYNECK